MPDPTTTITSSHPRSASASPWRGSRRRGRGTLMQGAVSRTEEAGPADAPGQPPPPGMRWIPGGTFAMGSEDFYPEERPVRRVTVDGFWMDERRSPRPSSPVRPRDEVRDRWPSARSTPAQYPDADPELLVPGSLVFRRAGPGRPERHRNWWEYVPGAHWSDPEGRARRSTAATRHPVVHVAYEDAEAYAPGREGAADRSGVGVRRARRARGRHLRLG